MDDRTASAVEFAILALKNNPQVTTIGSLSAGYTSANSGLFFGPNKKYAAIITVVEVKTNKNRIYNNQPIKPDVQTMYQSKAVMMGKSRPDSQDLDFLDELKKAIRQEEKD